MLNLFEPEVDMKLNQILELINGKILADTYAQHEYNYGFASDLMSDVLRYNMDNTILITGLSTIQTIRTAEMSNISCIIIARNKRVSVEMLELAYDNNITVIESSSTVYEISGKLYNNGLQPVIQ